MNPVSLLGHVLELFEQIDRNPKSPPDRLTSKFLKERHYLGSKDRRFVSETVFGMIRHRRFAEALLEQFITENSDTTALTAPHYRYLPLYVAYSLTIDGNDRYPIPASYWKTYFPAVEVQPFVDWIKANRSLSFLSDDDVVSLGVKYSFQDWMVAEWMEQIGTDVEQLLRALNAPASTTLRVNLLKTAREECQQRLQLEGVETKPTKYSPVGLTATKRFNTYASPTFQEGWFEVQDEGSQLVSLLAAPKPGDIVVDGAAGAGGKSLHIAELMKNEGELVAIDVDARRLRTLGERASRAGIGIIKRIPKGVLQPENFIDQADVVLVDAPCSGVGTIRRNPWLKWSVTASLVEHYSQLQREMLTFNARFVKPGGRLVYSTCSLFRQEDDEVVDSFLKSNPAFQPTHLRDQLSQLGISGEACFLPLYPHRYGTDGFFVAVMERK